MTTLVRFAVFTAEGFLSYDSGDLLWDGGRIMLERAVRVPQGGTVVSITGRQCSSNQLPPNVGGVLYSFLPGT